MPKVRCEPVRRAWICALCVALLAIDAAQVQADDTRNEFWPEAQFHLGFTPQTKLILLANITRTRKTHTSLEGQLGITLDHRFNDIFSMRAGYRYGTSLVADDPSTEHRILLEQTFRFRLPWKFLLSFRTREDLRFIDGDFSTRIRERAKLERDVEFEGYTFTPYGSAEIYYDTRFNRFARNRFILGAVFPVTKHFSVDAYIARQNDSRPQIKHVNALGLTLTFTF